VKVTDPPETVVAVGVTAHCFSATATSPPPAAELDGLVVVLVVALDGLVVEPEPEHAVAISSTDAGITAAHLPKNFIISHSPR
jgi:hypothetical protein